jgi:hypothetical protein
LLDAGTTPSRDVPERWPRERGAEPESTPDVRQTVLAGSSGTAGAVPAPADASADPSTAATANAVTPDLLGLTAREALRVARVRGVATRVRGQGFVVEQQPGAGEPLLPGQVVSLALALQKGR